MKKLVVILSVLVLFIGCDNPFLNTVQVDLPNQVTDLESAFMWVGNNISYKSDESVWGHEEYWQSPDTTMRLRTGDCEDFAILFSSFAYELGYIDSDVIVIKRNNKGHAISKIDGVFYDATPILCADGFYPSAFIQINYPPDIKDTLTITEAVQRCKYMYNN